MTDPTAPAVPSPQEELRAQIIAVLSPMDLNPFGPADWADAMLPLFAARVAAIERSLAGETELRVTFQAEAERAEAELAGARRVARENADYAKDRQKLRDAWEDRARKAEAELAVMTEEKIDALAGWDALRVVADRQWDDLTAAQERIAALSENSRYQRANSDAWMERALRAEERVAAERKQAAAQALEQATGESYSPAEITAAVIAVREFFPRIPTGNLIEELRATRALLTATVPATPEETS